MSHSRGDYSKYVNCFKGRAIVSSGRDYCFKDGRLSDNFKAKDGRLFEIGMIIVLKGGDSSSSW